MCVCVVWWLILSYLPTVHKDTNIILLKIPTYKHHIQEVHKAEPGFLKKGVHPLFFFRKVDLKKKNRPILPGDKMP